MTTIAIVAVLLLCRAFDRYAARKSNLERHYRNYLAGQELDPRD